MQLYDENILIPATPKELNPVLGWPITQFYTHLKFIIYKANKIFMIKSELQLVLLLYLCYLPLFINHQ